MLNMHGTFWVYIRKDYAINNRWITVNTPLVNILWDEPFLSRLYEIYLSIKDLENWAEFNLLPNLHLCTQNSVCARNFAPLGEIGANFSLQLSSRTQLATINNKKVIAENQCEKHKKSSFSRYTLPAKVSLDSNQPTSCCRARNTVYSDQIVVGCPLGVPISYYFLVWSTG